MSQAVIDSSISELPLPTRPLPLAQPIGNGWMPAIYHPDRIPEYLRFERFTRKAKTSAAAALEYAARTIWYRQRRENEKRRKLEILQGNLLRQTKLTPEGAMVVAERVYRENLRKADKRRKIEAIAHPRYFAVAAE